MKKYLIKLLSLITVISTLCCIVGCAKKTETAETETGEPQIAENAASVIRAAFEADFKESYSKETDGVIGIPVQLDNYSRNLAPSNGAGVLYVVGSGAVRAGTESDVSIIEDLLNDGFIVTVLDYMDNPKAECGIDLDKSVHGFLMEFCSGKYIADAALDRSRGYMLPAGCRIELGVYYYSLDKMAPYGTNEYIVDTYNTYYAGKKKDIFGKDLPVAKTVYDCTNKNTLPIILDLTMDIIYPSKPETTVPCFAVASSSETYYTSIATAGRPYMTAALLGGYAGMVYEHEYIPMSRDDHFGYNNDRFTLAPYVALHVHSAAVRRIRYLSETYGYNGDYLSVFGFSKSGYGPALLMDDNRWEKGEFETFDNYAPKGKNPKECPSEQPWLTYEGTNKPISDKPTVVYVGAGWAVYQAREFCIRDGVGPLMSSIGELDETAGIKNQIGYAIEKFNNTSGELYFLDLPDTKHNPPYVYDSEREADLFYVAWTFLDDHVRAAYREEPPKVLWMSPKSNQVYNGANSKVNIQVNFSRKMDAASMNEGIKVVRLSDNKPIKGTWKSAHDGLTFTFVSSEFSAGAEYSVTVSNECKAADGVSLTSTVSRTFTINK